MTETTDYTPPKVWRWNTPSGGRFANINRPIAGPTHEKELPVGRHPLQLYSLGTPNGVKVTIMLEELLARSHKGAEYDWKDQVSPGSPISSMAAQTEGSFFNDNRGVWFAGGPFRCDHDFLPCAARMAPVDIM